MSDQGKNKHLSADLLRLYAEGLVSPEQAKEIERRLTDHDRMVLESILTEKTDLAEDIEDASKKFDSVFEDASSSKIEGTLDGASPAQKNEDALDGVSPAQKIDDEFEAELSSRGFNRRLFIIAAAAAALAIFYVFKPPSPEKIVRQEMLAVYELQTFAGDPSMDLTATEAYTAGDFEEAYALFSALDLPTDSPETFYMGLSALYAKEFTRAAEIFEAIADSKSTYRQHTKWFLGLSYFRLGKKDSAKSQFQSIEPGEFKFERAQELAGRM